MNKLLFLFFSLISNLSYAGIFETTPNDKSIYLLSYVFGNLFSNGTSGEDPLYEGISTLNSAILIVGGFLLAYTIILATVETAQSGEMMGKKLSSIWVPIRIAFGTALVMPILKGGYCLIQMIVAWLITQGIGLADSAWTGYVSTKNINIISNTNVVSIDYKNFGYNVFKSYVCLEGTQKLIIDGKSSGTSLVPKIKKTETPTSTIIELGFNEEFGFKSDSCGIIEIPNIPTINNEKDRLLSHFQSDNYLKDFSKSALIAKTNIEATNVLITSMQNLAQNMVKTGSPISLNNIDLIIKNYENTLISVTQAEEKKITDSLLTNKTNSTDGWILAGFYYNKLFIEKEFLKKALLRKSTATGPNYIDNKSFNDKFLYYQSILAQTFGDISVVDSKLKNGNDEIKGKIISKEDSNRIIRKSIFNDVVGYFEINDNEHPLITSKRLGTWLIDIASNALDEGFGAMLSNNNSASTGIQTILLIFIAPIIIIGGILSYVIPMIPFLIWLMAIAGWLILCVEGIIFAPIWSIMHLNPHGEDLIGKGGKGYKILLGLMLRPIIMILTIIASFVLLDIIGKLINTVFFSLFSITQFETKIFTMLTGFIFISAIYALTLFLIIKKIFSMTYIIPEKLFSWIDSGSSSANAYINNTIQQNENPPIPTQINNLVNSISGIIDTGKSLISGNGFSKNDHKEHTNKKEVKNKEQNKNLEKEFGKEFGKEGVAFIDYASNGGKNKINGAAASNAISNQVNILGGKNAMGTMTFLQKLNESIEDEMKKLQHEQANWKDVFGGVSKESINKEFGEGSSNILGRVGGGGLDKNGKTKFSLIGQKFVDGALQYQRKVNKWKKSGLSHDEIINILESSNKKILYNYANSPDSIKNGGTKTMEDFMNEELAKIIF